MAFIPPHHYSLAISHSASQITPLPLSVWCNQVFPGFGRHRGNAWVMGSIAAIPLLRLSNVRLTLLRGVPPVDTADVGKNMNILCQRGKWDIFRILKARFSLCSALPLLCSHSQSHSLTLQRSPFLRLPLLRSFSCSHCCSQTLPSRGLTVALNLSVLVLSLSLSSLSLCRLRRFLCAMKVFALCVLAKGWFFISFMFEKHVKVVVLSDC